MRARTPLAKRRAFWKKKKEEEIKETESEDPFADSVDCFKRFKTECRPDQAKSEESKDRSLHYKEEDETQLLRIVTQVSLASTLRGFVQKGNDKINRAEKVGQSSQGATARGSKKISPHVEVEKDERLAAGSSSEQK